MSTLASAITPEFEAQLTSLRTQKSLAHLAPADEGTPLGRLPDNIYGFTSSPVNELTPLFTKRIYQSFEVHKLTAGVVHIIGFVTPDAAASIFEGTEPVDIDLYPEPHGDAQRLVEIPLPRIVRARNVSRMNGNFMPIHLDPA
ncbi:MAG: hypothetical protein R2729_06510 [Bryobacteraceae bacterium]